LDTGCLDTGCLDMDRLLGYIQVAWIRKGCLSWIFLGLNTKHEVQSTKGCYEAASDTGCCLVIQDVA
jgi:hypothetical protein